MAVPLFAPALSIPAPPLDWNAMLNNPSAFARLLRKREVLGFGAFGVVYEVEGAAVKIGCVDGNEPIISSGCMRHSVLPCQFGRASRRSSCRAS